MQKNQDGGAGPLDARDEDSRPSAADEAETNGDQPEDKDEDKDYVAPFAVDLSEADPVTAPPTGKSETVDEHEKEAGKDEAVPDGDGEPRDQREGSAQGPSPTDNLPDSWDDLDSDGPRRDEPAEGSEDEADEEWSDNESDDNDGDKDDADEGDDVDESHDVNDEWYDDADPEDAPRDAETEGIGGDNVTVPAEDAETNFPDQAQAPELWDEEDEQEDRPTEVQQQEGEEEEEESSVVWSSRLEREFDPVSSADEDDSNSRWSDAGADAVPDVPSAGDSADDTDDWEAEETPPAVAAPAAEHAPRRSIWSWLAVVCLAGVAGAATGWLPGKLDDFLGRAVEPATLPQLKSVESRIDGVESDLRAMRADPSVTKLREQVDLIAPQIDRLEARVDAIAAQIALLGSEDQRTAGTLGRLAAIERSLSELTRVAASISLAAKALEDRQDSLDATVGSQRRRLDEISFLTGAGRSVTGQSIDERFRAMETRIAERVTVLESRPRGVEAKLAAFVLAVGQLRLALRTGDPFEGALDSVTATAPDDDKISGQVAVLAPLGAEGVRTLAHLQRSYDSVALEVVRAASRPPGDTWVDKTVARLSELVTVRRVGDSVEGEGADAVVARAESRLKSGELDAAVAELHHLEGATAEAAESWIRSANDRLKADEAMIRLESRAIKLLESLG